MLALRQLLTVVLTLGAASCGMTDSGPSCAGGKCDDAGDVRDQLEGLDEAIADWLRASPMTDDGILETDYMAAMIQLASFSGCDIDTLATFVLSDDLVVGQPFPRLISTLCSDDDTRAAELFVAASFPDPDHPADIDRRNLEMFAWDRTQRRYVFYATLPVEGSETEVQVEVEPARCASCHLNGDHLDDAAMPMLPIMNELITPWPHWSSEPDFPSHTFELPEGIAMGPTFAELTGEGRLGAAAGLEQIIRAAQTTRVIPERLKRRRVQPATVDEAMALLRPIFCDEQVAYVTEDANLLPGAAVLAPELREAYLAIRPTDWPFAWINDERIRFAAPSDAPITMLPVRGNADLEYSRRLVAVRGLSPEQLLRVQALDWQRPVFSEFRCGLWREARARVRAAPPDIAAEMRNSDLLPVLYEEIMRPGGGASLIVDTDRGEATELVIMADAESSAAALAASLAGEGLDSASCADGADGFCRADLPAFAAMLQVRADEAAADRDVVRDDAGRRFCFVRDSFPSRPALPPGSCRGPDKGFETQSEPDPLMVPRAGSNPEVRLIPDGTGTLESAIEIDVEGAAVAGSVRVRLRIDHSWRGDLSIVLVAPGGAELAVATFDPADSADDVEAVLTALEPTDGMAAAGTWTLRVTDRAAGEQGFLLGWSIGINQEAPSLDLPGSRPPPL
jgi:hypothetical protein